MVRPLSVPETDVNVSRYAARSNWRLPRRPCAPCEADQTEDISPERVSVPNRLISGPRVGRVDHAHGLRSGAINEARTMVARHDRRGEDGAS